MQSGFGGSKQDYTWSLCNEHKLYDTFSQVKTFEVFLHFLSAVPSTNPFVAAAVIPEMATNPFQTNGRAPAAGVCACVWVCLGACVFDVQCICSATVLLRFLCLFDVTQLHYQVVMWLARVCRIFSSLCVLWVCVHSLYTRAVCVSHSLIWYRLYEHARRLWECVFLLPPDQFQRKLPAAIPWPGPHPLQSAWGLPPSV